MYIHKFNYTNLHDVHYIYSLSSHLESYFSVRLKLYSFRPVVMLYRSVRNITVSAFVNSAFVPEYCAAAQREKEQGIEAGGVVVVKVVVPVGKWDNLKKKG